MSEYYDKALDGSWSNANFDSVRIDKLITRINELIETLSHGDNSIKVVSLLTQLAVELVTKLPVTKVNVDERKEKNLSHPILTDANTLYIKVVRQRNKVFEDDLTEVRRIFYECLYMKQNILKMGIWYQDDDEEQDLSKV
jgi:hypothetical protein